jgi:hypothetical protein
MLAATQKIGYVQRQCPRTSICYSDSVAEQFRKLVTSMGLALQIVTKPGFYF